jgi:hypothetical protein
LLQARSRSVIRVGAFAEFKDKNGVVRTIQITRVNAKSVTGLENGKLRWRVSPQFLTVRTLPSAPVITAERHVPKTEATAVW